MTEEEYLYWSSAIAKYSPRNSDALEYLERFKGTPFPVLFGIPHIAHTLGLNSLVISSIVHSPEKFYREFTIKKRSGKDRTINAPYPVLKTIQRWILDSIISKIPLNSAATGFVPGRSLLDNVKPHLAAGSYLKIDLLDFFPSIGFKRVWSIFNRCGYSNKVSYYLSSLCCLHGALPQGSPVSPAITNVICKRLDSRLKGLAKKFDLAYSRYADDIAFSGPRISWRFSNYVEHIVREELLNINHEKTRLSTGRGNKILTGISINGQEAKLPRSRRRQYRAEAHNLLKLKPLEYASTIFAEDPVALERVIGKFNFWKFVEPNSLYVQETLAKLKNLSDETYAVTPHLSGSDRDNLGVIEGQT